MFFFKNQILSEIAAIILLPLTLIYHFTVKIRYLLFKRGYIKRYIPEIYTISVGNITVGGTGKTPLVIDLVKEFSKKGYSPAVITRGYGRKSSSRIEVTKDTPVNTSGDEAAEIFKKTGCTVICDKDRSSAISYINGQNDIVILDDAFQHLRVSAHLNIVMIDERRFFGNKLLLPSGILRDRISRLRSADVIVLSKVRDFHSPETKQKILKLKKYCKNILISAIRVSNFTQKGKEFSLKHFENKKIGLFCGIGSPDDFFALFEGMDIVKKLPLPDHYRYTEPERILEAFEGKCDVLITTYKDFVKLTTDVVSRNNIFCLETNNIYYNVSFEEKTLCEHLKPLLPVKDHK